MAWTLLFLESIVILILIIVVFFDFDYFHNGSDKYVISLSAISFLGISKAKCVRIQTLKNTRVKERLK